MSSLLVGYVGIVPRKPISDVEPEDEFEDDDTDEDDEFIDDDDED